MDVNIKEISESYTKSALKEIVYNLDVSIQRLWTVKKPTRISSSTCLAQIMYMYFEFFFPTIDIAVC